MWFNKKKDKVQITSVSNKDDTTMPGPSSTQNAMDQTDGGINNIYQLIIILL